MTVKRTSNSIMQAFLLPPCRCEGPGLCIPSSSGFSTVPSEKNGQNQHNTFHHQESDGQQYPNKDVSQSKENYVHYHSANIKLNICISIRKVTKFFSNHQIIRDSILLFQYKITQCFSLNFYINFSFFF